MKKILLVLLFIAFIPFFFISCKEEVGITCYNIEMTYDDVNKTIVASQKVSYANNSDNSFKDLYFHLYPNAFRDDATKRPVSLANFSSAYPNGESYGGIEIKSVKVQNANCNFIIEGEDQNILKVPLNFELFPNEMVEVDMEYVVILPNINHRFGYGENTVNIANFYPIACVYEDGVGFFKDLYSSNGDPFYSDMANYNVVLTCDSDFVVANSGNVSSQTKCGDQKNIEIKESKIRDFAIVLSKKYEKLTEKHENIEINYYFYNDESSEETLEFSVDVLSFYNNKFGVYPYKQLSVVQNNFVYGGMEYPNLVMISDSLCRENQYYVIAHEIAHQWWYGVVGNDEYNEAWVDESLTEYSTALFFENHKQYGFEYEKIVTNANTSFKFFYDIYNKVYENVDTSMNRSLDDFETEPEYVHSVYTQGVIMYDSLRSLISEKKFYKCCQDYYKKMAYKNSRGVDLIAIFSNSSGRNLESFFNSYLNGEVLIA